MPVRNVIIKPDRFFYLPGRKFRQSPFVENDKFLRGIALPKSLNLSRKHRKLLFVGGLALALYLLSFYNTRQEDARSISYLQSVAVDGRSNIYVPSNGCIRKFDVQGKFQGVLGPWQCVTEAYNHSLILSLAVDHAGNFYVETYTSSQNPNQFLKLDPEGRVLFNIGQAGNGPGEFGSSSASAQFAIDPANNIYITDYSNYRVQKFDSQGHFLAQIGSKGPGPGQFETGFNIAVDSQGNLYTGDSDPRPNKQSPRLQKFDSQGNFTGLIGQANLTAERNPNAVRMDQISTLGPMTFDDEGNLNVVAGYWSSFDYNFYLVKFRSTGEYIGKYGSPRSYPPRGLAASQENGIVYEAFSEAPRSADTIVKFDTKSNTQTVLISSSWTNYLFWALLMAVAALVEFWVVESFVRSAFSKLFRKKKKDTAPVTPLNNIWPD